MASGYSQIGSTYRHLQPVSTFQGELVAQVLGSKQQSYNANVAKIDEALEQYSSIDLARAEDKEYLYNRLNTLSSEINNAGMQDLSSSAVTRNIQRHIDQAIDSKVLTQAGNTQKVRQFQSTVQTTKEKNPELYSDANAAYALNTAGYQKWMNGETDQLGNLEYTPYTKVAQTYRDRFDEAVSVKKGMTTQVPDPNNPGYFLKTTEQGMSEQDVRQTVLTLLTPQEQKQLEIDAWAKYGSNSEEVYQGYVAPKVEQYNKQISALQFNLDGKTDAQKAEINQKINSLQSAKKDLVGRKESPSALYGFLGREDLVAGLSQEYKPIITAYEMTKDPVAIEAMKKKSSSINQALNLDANATGTVDVTTITKPTELSDEERNIELDRTLEAELMNNNASLEGMYNKVYNNLPAEKRTQMDSAYEVYLENNNLTDDPATKTAWLVDNSDGGKGGLLTPTEITVAKSLIRNQRKAMQSKATAWDQALANKDEQYIGGLIKGLKENPNIKITDSSGKVVSGRDFLQGVESAEQLSPEKKRTLLRSSLADITLSQSVNYDPNSESNTHTKSTYNILRLARVNGEGDKDLPVIVNPSMINVSSFSERDYDNDFEEMKKRMQLPSSLTKTQFDQYITPILKSTYASPLGEKSANFIGKIADALPGAGVKQAITRMGANLGTALGLRDVTTSLIIGGEGTQTRRDIEIAMENGTYDKSYSIFDDSVEDDADTRRLLDDREEVKAAYRKNLFNQAPNIASTQVVIVEPSGTREGENVPAWEELRTKAYEQGAAFDKKPISVEDRGEYYRLYQVEKSIETNSKGEQIPKQSIKEAQVLKKDLAGGEFMNWIGIEAANKVTTENTKELYTDNITYADENSHTSYLADINKSFFKGSATPAQLRSLTKQGAKDLLLTKHQTLFQSDQAPIYKDLVNRMIENSHLFKIKLEDNSGTFMMKIQYADGNEMKTLKAIPTGTNDLTANMYQFDVMEQKFYTEYIDRLLSEIENKGADSVADQLNTLEKIFYPNAG